MHATGAPSLSGHFKIMRIDHWIKNLFVLPGLLVALTVEPKKAAFELVPAMLLGILAIGLVASSNYVINEVLDAPYDRENPIKRQRPVPAGQVNVSLAYVQWVALMILGVGFGTLVSIPFAVTMIALWLMGCIYNFEPIRSKDIPYVDVLTEALNNPLRMLAGWFIVEPPVSLIPVSLLVSYWMIGAYFMAIKRFAEFRDLENAGQAARYRRSFAFYSEPRLLISIIFYASVAMLFLGAFIMRYRLELVLSFPLVALVMSIYLALAFKPGSAVQAPEKLYREPLLLAAVIVCATVMATLLFLDIPILYRIFKPTLPAPREISSVESVSSPSGGR
jgi:decaprenyl-phosphate phosphoribosyltransferase